MTQFNPEMLILAREMRALSQEELAAEADVSQSKVSKIEAGMLLPSEDDFARFARALKVPIALFHRSGLRAAPGSSCIFHRKRQTVPAKELKRLHACLDYLRIQVEQLLTGVDLRAPQSIYRIDADAFDGDVEQVARMVRQTWLLAHGPVPSLINVIESAGGVVVKTSFGTDKVDAICQWPKGSPPLFYVNADAPADRVRFSLAHELGHLVMHALPTGDIEREADRFASEFLMPATDILPELMGKVDVKKLAALKPRWKVSMQAIARRAKDLGVISEQQYRILLMTISKLGWRKSEPVQIPAESPTLIPTMIDLYVKQRGFSENDIRTMVYCASEKDFIGTFHAFERKETQLRLVQ